MNISTVNELIRSLESAGELSIREQKFLKLAKAYQQLASLKPEEQREKVSEIEAATAGTTGHEKARRQRQILGDAKPRLKTRKEITKALESAEGEYASALRWVLGEAV